MSKLFIVAILLAFNTVSKAQDKVLAAEAKPFLISGYEMLDYVIGDLNGDKKADAILILKKQGEEDLTDETPRPLLILIRQANGKLKQEKRSDDIVMCRQCGGVFGDPYDATTIENNGFVINFYGGSSWRWGYEYSFTYKATAKNWYLIKEKQISFQSGDPETTMKETVIEQPELGDITINKFSSSQPYVEAKWKVTAAKTFFYDNPKIGSKPRKGYLLKGNEATQLRELKNFVEVSFENAKGQFTNGFILKKDLVKL